MTKDKREWVRPASDEAAVPRPAMLERIRNVAETVRTNAFLFGAASVTAIAAAASASTLSWRTLMDIKIRAESGETLAVLVPLGFGILTLAGAQVAWSITSGTKILAGNKAADETASRIEKRMDAMSARMDAMSSRVEGIQHEQGGIKVSLDIVEQNVTAAQKYEIVQDDKDLWTGFTQKMLSDGARGDKEVTLRLNPDGAYTAIARAERIGGYVLDRLLAQGGLSQWTVTLYLRTDVTRPFERLAREPLIRFFVMVKAARAIAENRGLAIDLGKLKIVVCDGEKPDVATFVVFRKRLDGLFEKVLIDYSRPLDPNRAHQTKDRATLVRCPQEIAERESEIEARVARGKVLSLDELADLATPYLRDVLIVDPDNLPGVGNGDHFVLGEPWRLTFSDEPPYPAASSAAG